MSKIDNLNAILQGWKNVIFKDADTEAIAKYRASICAGCNKNKNSICTKCNCPLVSLLRQNIKKCKLKKW